MPHAHDERRATMPPHVHDHEPIFIFTTMYIVSISSAIAQHLSFFFSGKGLLLGLYVGLGDLLHSRLKEWSFDLGEDDLTFRYRSNCHSVLAMETKYFMLASLHPL